MYQEDGALLSAYVIGRIVEIKNEHRLPMVTLAEIMGYERAAMHRLIKYKKLPSVNSLYCLSQYFGVPMSHWFPEAELNLRPVADSVQLKRAAADASTLVKQAVAAICKLPATDKQRVLKILSGGPELLTDVLGTAESFQNIDAFARRRIIAAVATIAAEKKSRPVP